MISEKIIRRPTIDHYTKFMLEDKDGLSPHRRMELHKSNLILNFRYMGRKDRKKAAIEIVTCELNLQCRCVFNALPTLFAALIMENLLSPGLMQFSDNSNSSLANCFKPTIANLLIKRAWDSRNLHIILEEKKIVLDDHS